MRFWPFSPVDRSISLHTRVGLVLTALAASLLVLLAGLWLHSTRNAIHEEVEAATRVSEQWLRLVAAEVATLPAAEQGDRLRGMLRGLGRVRANQLQLHGPTGEVQYTSPASTYKVGRAAPAWFTALLISELPARSLAVGDYRISLHPDPSRAQLDAWDELQAMAGWAGLLLLTLFVGSRLALVRALRPLGQVMHGLDRLGHGRFDTRLPQFATPELARLARAFNGMADRLHAAIVDNVRLETEREVAEQLQGRLQAERRDIARELHDELAQGITAVRALAGAIVQRSSEQPAVQGPAQSIVAVTGEMQDGVRQILQRLRPPPGGELGMQVERLLAGWQGQHPEIALNSRIALGDGQFDTALAQSVLRIVQEGLTNIVRHAAASQVSLTLLRHDDGLQLGLADNGRGNDGRPSAQAGCGLGLTGMRERIALLGGHLEIDCPSGGGFRLRVSLPLRAEEEMAC